MGAFDEVGGHHDKSHLEYRTICQYSSIRESLALSPPSFCRPVRVGALRKADEREIDQFDTADAIHLPLIDDEGQVLGYSRLLKTTAPHLLSDVYPELMDGRTWPTGETIYEWTRCVAEPNATIRGIQASNVLLTGVLEYCLTSGISALIVETHPKLVQLLVNNDWNVLRCVLQPCLAPIWFCDPRRDFSTGPDGTSPKLRHQWQHLICHFVRQIPLRPHDELRRLPYLDGQHVDVSAAMRIAGE